MNKWGFNVIMFFALALISACAPNVQKLADEEDYYGLIEIIETGSPEEREEASDALVKMGAGYTDVIVRALRNPNPEVRDCLIQTLVEIGQPGVRWYISDLGTATPLVQEGIIDVLGLIGDPEFVEPLIKKANDEKLKVRVAVIRALGRIGTSEVVKPLLEAMDSKDMEVRKAAEDAFSNLDPSLAEKITGYLIYNPGFNTRRAAADALDLMGWKPEGCEIAAWYYSVKGDYQLAAECGIYAIEPLLLCLSFNEYYGEDSPYFSTSAEIEQALDDSSGTEIQPLIDLFGVIRTDGSHADSYAVETLAAIGEPAVPQLIDALSVYQESNLASIVEILGQIGDQRAVGPLLGILQYNDYKNARIEAANALLMMDEPRVIPVLIDYLAGDDDEMYRVAVRNLAAYFSDDPSPLLSYLNNKNTLQVYHVLMVIGDPATLPNLISALNKFDNKEMAETFLNSGNNTLEAAAEKWAEDNGYQVFPGGGYTPGWGGD